MKSYAPYHHMYAISVIYNVINGVQGEVVIDPVVALKKLEDNNLLDYAVCMAGNCLNMALENASNEQQIGNRVFSQQNWIKAKKCLTDIRSAISTTINSLRLIPGGMETYNNLIRIQIIPER